MPQSAVSEGFGKYKDIYIEILTLTRIYIIAP